MTSHLATILVLLVLATPAVAQKGQPFSRDEDRDRDRQLTQTARHAAQAAPHVKFPDSRAHHPARFTPPKTVPVKPNGSWRGWLVGIGAAIAGAFGALFRSRQK